MNYYLIPFLFVGFIAFLLLVITWLRYIIDISANRQPTLQGARGHPKQEEGK